MEGLKNKTGGGFLSSSLPFCYSNLLNAVAKRSQRCGEGNRKENRQNFPSVLSLELHNPIKVSLCNCSSLFLSYKEKEFTHMSEGSMQISCFSVRKDM